MALGINSNIASINAQNQLGKSQSLSNQALERLSSGLRINSAKDDAAGMAISTRFDAQVRGLTVAQRNANDGISLAQTTEGALNEVTNNLQRIRELAVQAANGTNGDEDKAALQQEVTDRMAEIDRLTTDTKFNGIQVLNGGVPAGGGAAAALVFQVGADSGQTISIDMTSHVMDTATLTGGALDITGDNAAVGAEIVKIDEALTKVNDFRSELGAVQNRFESTIANLGTSIENMSAANSRILDADFAAESAKMAKANVLQQAGISVLAQANARPNQVLSLLQ
ncbi:flagellin [Marinobacter salexigens]|uniref:flagellin N-terminal helical domain-containing protein n=1 Tax=Marinobacter salexigens TaxID=1925763 RepID=UPI000C28B03B|nr:flagellin [Marinobacter salexigens]